jgi:hypothetical protein
MGTAAARDLSSMYALLAAKPLLVTKLSRHTVVDVIVPSLSVDAAATPDPNSLEIAPSSRHTIAHYTQNTDPTRNNMLDATP